MSPRSPAPDPRDLLDIDIDGTGPFLGAQVLTDEKLRA
jgi:hypothetical protein